MRLISHEEYIIDFDDRDGETLHVIFSDRYRPGKLLPLWRDEARKSGVSAIFITAKCDWPHYTDIIPLLAFHCQRFERVVTYGVGIGANAALNHSQSLKSNGTIVFSPIMNEFLPIKPIKNSFVIFDRKHSESTSVVEKLKPFVKKTFNLSFTGQNSSQFLSDLNKIDLLFSHDGQTQEIGVSVRKIGDAFDEFGVNTSGVVLNSALAKGKSERYSYLKQVGEDKKTIVYGAGSADYLQYLFAQIDPRNEDIEYIAYCRKVKVKSTIQEAEAHLKKSLTLNPNNAYRYYQYAELLARLKKWEQSISAYQQAILKGEDQLEYRYLLPIWHYNLSKVFSKVWDTENSFKSYDIWLKSYPYTRKADRIIRSVEAHKVCHFIEDVAGTLKQNYKNSNITLNNTVDMPRFVYWAQGIDENTPQIVRNAVSSTLKHTKNIILLDDKKIEDYIEIPGYIWDLVRKNKMSKTHFSDVLRNLLLSNYGGAWIDATCFCNPDINAFIEDCCTYDYFAFSAGENNKARISNWFLTSQKNGYIINHLRESLLEYWKTYDYLDDYFLYHHAFRALYNIDFEFKNTWDSVPLVFNRKAYTLIKRNNDKMNNGEFKKIVDGSPIHKMTYKFQSIVPNSFLDHVINNCKDGDLIKAY